MTKKIFVSFDYDKDKNYKYLLNALTRDIRNKRNELADMLEVLNNAEN